jgi:hypothetical protein
MKKLIKILSLFKRKKPITKLIESYGMTCKDIKEKFEENGNRIVFYDNDGRETMDVNNINAVRITETMTRKEAAEFLDEPNK